MGETAIATTQIPTSAYVTVGVLILGNLTVILTLLTFIFKSGMFVAETKVGIKDAKDTAVRAHKRIDEVEEKTEINVTEGES